MWMVLTLFLPWSLLILKLTFEDYFVPCGVECLVFVQPVVEVWEDVHDVAVVGDVRSRNVSHLEVVEHDAAFIQAELRVQRQLGCRQPAPVLPGHAEHVAFDLAGHREWSLPGLA